jgi:hypothetical protein
MKPEHYLLLAIATLIICFLWLFIKGCKKKQADKFDKIPFVFYMHGKRFTPEGASEYYDLQKIRSVDPYLMIYDTEAKEYVFKGQYSYYEKEYVTLRDNLYHE